MKLIITLNKKWMDENKVQAGAFFSSFLAQCEATYPYVMFTENSADSYTLEFTENPIVTMSGIGELLESCFDSEEEYNRACSIEFPKDEEETKNKNDEVTADNAEAAVDAGAEDVAEAEYKEFWEAPVSPDTSFGAWLASVREQSEQTAQQCADESAPESEAEDGEDDNAEQTDNVGTEDIVTVISEQVDPLPTPEEKQLKILAEIDDLVAAEDFKQFCHDIHRRASVMRMHKSQAAFFRMAYLFYISEGYDLEPYTRLLKNLLVEERIFSGTSVVTHEYTLPKYGQSNDDEDAMRHAIDSLDCRESRAVFLIDYNQWVGHTEARLFKEYLKELSKLLCRKQVLAIFHCNPQSEALTRKAQLDFNDLIFSRSVQIRDYTCAELRGVAEGMLGQYGYKMTEEAKALFEQKLTEERKDGYFYGCDTVKKVTVEMIYAHETYGIANSDEISDVDMRRLLDAHADPQSSQALLSKVYGLDAVKKQIFDICNSILFARKNHIKLPSLHMKFVGNPGTGKTTVARIVGKILSEAGALRVGNLYEHTGRDFCGEYVGHTAKITRKLCAEAYGSVLFIDEAYSLMGVKDHRDIYGQEAIDTLITEMENHADDMIVIFAGYPDEMEEFERMNPGLKSRIAYTINFPGYTVDELYHIFELMATAEFECSTEYLNAAKAYFYSLPESVRADKHFGNARFVRNLYERSWSIAAGRSAESGEKAVLLRSDFEAAVAAVTGDTAKKRRIGFD